jgi:hypothetical protein
MDDVRPEAVAAIRALDESAAPRSYWHLRREDDGSDWFVETVNDGGTERPVKQLVVDSFGLTYRYWWGHLEDEAGFLDDQPVDPLLADVEPIDAQAFLNRWHDR